MKEKGRDVQEPTKWGQYTRTLCIESYFVSKKKKRHFFDMRRIFLMLKENEAIRKLMCLIENKQRKLLPLNMGNIF